MKRDVQQVREYDPDYKEKCDQLEADGYRLVSDSPSGRRTYLLLGEKKVKRSKRKVVSDDVPESTDATNEVDNGE